MATPVLDTLVGGILPHVHFKKIIVEDATESAKDVGNFTHKITVQMELYQRKDELLTKSWLKDLDLVLGDTYVQNTELAGFETKKITSLFDFFNLNIILVQSNRNINLLRKSDPLPNEKDAATWNDDKSVFLHKALSDNRDPWWDPFCFKHGMGDPFARQIKLPISLAGLVGLTEGQKGHGEPLKEYNQGQVREEVHNGKVYYAIPYEHSFFWHATVDRKQNPAIASPQGVTSDVETTSVFIDSGIPGSFIQLIDTATAPNLGIAAYTSLDLASVFGQLQVGLGGSSFADQLNMEGPISAEVILRDSQVPTTQEYFVKLTGDQWSGPVHYHSSENPGPNGYIGYMTGEFHTPDEPQEKLQVAEITNTLVHDHTDPLTQKTQDQLIQVIDGQVIVSGTDNISNIGPAYKKIEKELGIAVSPLQKEVRKDLVKDNDTEYSKLYITRDRNGAAHGMFYIDIFSLLKNNSQLFPYLSELALLDQDLISEIVDYSKIIDLSLKRVRVNSTYGINGYQEFQDDKSNEPPVKIISCLRDNEGKDSETTYKAGGTLQEKYLSGVGNQYTRYFVFYDYDIASQNAGSYRYEVEMKFHDGTQQWFRNTLQRLMNLTVELESYYKLSVSNVNVGDINEETFYMGLKGKDTVKKTFKPYYDNRYKTFRHEFAMRAKELFSNPSGVWERTATEIWYYMMWFNIEKHQASTSGADTGIFGEKYFSKILKLMLPGPKVSGSPEGILICLNIMRNICSEFEKIIGGVKKKKKNNSNVLQDYTANDDFQQLPMQFYETGGSTVHSIIEEKHSFDHPNEIFKVYPNKDVYVDFLSVTQTMIAQINPETEEVSYKEYIAPLPGRPPVRRISTSYFRRRCKADLAKYTNYALWNGFNGSDALLKGQAIKGQNGVQDGGNISPFPPAGSAAVQERIARPDGRMDTLNSQLYSYLTPSIIELSDPTKSNVSWGFRYSAFNQNTLNIMETGKTGGELGDIYSSEYFNKSTQNANLISLANYVKNRDEFEYADLSNAFNHNSEFFADLKTFVQQDKKDDLIKREAHKSFFEKYNITVYDSKKYSDFFGSDGDKDPGATGYPYVGNTPGIKIQYPFRADQYADMFLQSDEVLSSFTAGKEAVVRIPNGMLSISNGQKGYDFDFPNVYKIAPLYQNFNSHGKNINFVRTPMIDILENPEINNASIFFNFNMVAKIEKFIGYGTKKGYGSLAVDDKWTLLREQDLASDNIFCKISYYDRKMVGDVESIPILDRYFFLADVPEEETYKINPIAFDPTITKGPPSVDAKHFEMMNNKKLQEIMQVLEKGMLVDGGPPPVLNIPQTGGDPSPIEMTGADMMTGGSMQQVTDAVATPAGPAGTSGIPGVGTDMGSGGGGGGGGFGGGGGYP